MIFSSLEGALAWIAENSLTGLLSAYDLDRPAFDTRRSSGELPRLLRRRLEAGVLSVKDVEQYVDGREHYHFFFGLGEEDPGFHEATDRWDLTN